MDAPVINPSDRHSTIRLTTDLWSTHYVDEPYNIEFGQIDKDASQEQENSGIPSGLTQLELLPDSTKITYDLEAAVSRQKTFFYQVSFQSIVGFTRTASDTGH